MGELLEYGLRLQAKLETGAERVFRECTELNPDGSVEHFYLALCLAEQKKYEEAAIEFELASRLEAESSDEWESHFFKAACLLYQDRRTEAHTALQETISRSHASFPERFDNGCTEFLVDGGAGLPSRILDIRRDSFYLWKEIDFESPSEADFWEGIWNFLSEDFERAHKIFHSLADAGENSDVIEYWLSICSANLHDPAKALQHARRAVELGPTNPENYYWLSRLLNEDDTNREIALLGAIRLKPEHWNAWFDIAELFKRKGDFLKAEEAYRESIRLHPKCSDSYLPLASLLISQNRLSDAEEVLRRGLAAEIKEYDNWFNFNRTELAHLVFLQGRVAEAQDLLRGGRDSEEGVQEILNRWQHEHSDSQMKASTKSTPKDSFEDFLVAGDTWLTAAQWSTPHSSALLKEVWQHSGSWTDANSTLFPEFYVDQDYLDESLARAESLANHCRLAPEMPVYLDTSNLTIALTTESGFLRAWVGRGYRGIAVSVNLSSFDLYFLGGHRDAMFAVGAALNWFLDCSVLAPNERQAQFELNTLTNSQIRSPLSELETTWTTRSAFASQIRDIRSGKTTMPPRAHRVRGHIRRLSEGRPSEGARGNAPAYIRRNMGPNDTFVKAHQRGEQENARQLLNRIQTMSSLADYVALASQHHSEGRCA